MQLETQAEKIDVARKICAIYEKGNHSIVSACESVGLPSRTFYEWKTRIAEVAELYKSAQKTAMSERVEILKEISLTSFGKLLTGFTVDEESTEYTVDAKGKATISKVKKTKKFIPPSVGAVIYALKVADPGMFNKVNTGLGSPEDDGPVKKQVFIIGGKEIEF